MIQIEIPGKETLNIETIVFDFNGTLACDGIIPPKIQEKLKLLKEQVHLVVATADTHGTAQEQCLALGIAVETYPTVYAASFKVNVVQRLFGEVACIGNGFNDGPMCEASDLSVAVIDPEGCWPGLFSICDIVVTSIDSALDLFLKPKRIQAILRT